MPSNTKNIILDKATDLFYEHGFAKASIRDIAKEVNITNSTLYIHFKNKDRILYHIIQDIGNFTVQELRKVCEKHDDPVECLRDLIYTQVCVIKTKRKNVKIYMEEQYQLSRDLRKKAIAQHRKIYDLYYNKICEIEKRHPESLNKHVNKTVLTFSIFAVMNWTYRWYNDKGVLSIEQVAEQTANLIFNGMFSKGFL